MRVCKWVTCGLGSEAGASSCAMMSTTVQRLPLLCRRTADTKSRPLQHVAPGRIEETALSACFLPTPLQLTPLIGVREADHVYSDREGNRSYREWLT